MNAAPAPRIEALDLVRGVAVLGIVAINIAGFAGPPSWAYMPGGAGARTAADVWTFAAGFVLFEGKMRALFSILFGASLLLFIDRAEAAGRDGLHLQVRRLGWLALLGYLHFLLLWDGDILFLYAIAGMAALFLRRAEPAPLVAAALLLFGAWQAYGVGKWAPASVAEQLVLGGTASEKTEAGYRSQIQTRRELDRKDLAAMRAGYADEVGHKLTEKPFFPLTLVVVVIGETLAYVMIGMALLRTGFFAGGWSRRRLWQTAALGLGLGGAATLAVARLAMAQGWPEMLMHLLINYGLGFPHLLMALGYAALLVLAAPRLAASWLGDRLAAAGRMAFSNYIATSLVMTGLFHGWGLGLAGTVPQAQLPLYVAGMWLLMLGWSRPWLSRYRQGPLEWLWRSLTEARVLRWRREAGIRPPG